MICSEDEFVQQQLSNLREKLSDRNYPDALITQQFDRAMAIDRADLLRPRTYPHGASPVQPSTGRRQLIGHSIHLYLQFCPSSSRKVDGGGVSPSPIIRKEQEGFPEKTQCRLPPAT